MDEESGARATARRHMERVRYLEDVDSLLSWDQQTMMPSGGSPARAKQRAELSRIVHTTLDNDELTAALESIDPTELGTDDRADIRELRRRHERAVRVPESVIKRHADLASEAQGIWEDAKAASDFGQFADTLAELRDLRLERAQHIDPDQDPYAVMYARRMPTFPLGTARALLAEITPPIKALLADIRESDRTLARPFEGRTVPPAEQEALSEAVLAEFGLDRERSRFDTAEHPFTSGNAFDTRFTTRYRPGAPLDGFTATIHEYGHATYDMGLPQEAYGRFLGTDRREVHESQSRFWENHIGRSLAFWDRFAPTVRDTLSIDEDLDARALYEAANRVTPHPIRVEADELTYHLHIRVRADIEREFVAGEIDVMEIPERWNELMAEHLGIRPESDARGCLQDVHWNTRFAGFQTYTVGSVLAAQLAEAMRTDVDIEGCIRDGAYDRIREWMTEHVHRHGRRYEASELIERATGQPPTAEPFVRYIEDKFRTLYTV